MDKLSNEIYKTIHNKNKSIETIAENTGIKVGTLYRYSLPPQTTGLDVPIRRMQKIMKATKHYGPLKQLNINCGFLAVRLPRSPANKRDEIELINHFQQTCNSAINKLLAFYAKATTEMQKSTISALQNLASESIGIQKRIANYKQLELNFG